MTRGGFTLLEILVALLLLAITAAALAQGYGASLRAVGAAEDLARATVNARSLLASAQAGAPLAATGTTPDGARWRIDRRSRRDLAPGAGGIEPVEITATVTTGTGRRVELHGLDWAAQPLR